MSVILGMCSRWYVSYWTSWFSLFNLRLCLTRLSDVLDPDEVWALARLAGSAEIRYCKGSRTSSQWRLARSCRVFRPAGFRVRQYKRAALPQGSQSISSQITRKSKHGEAPCLTNDLFVSYQDEQEERLTATKNDSMYVHVKE